MAVPKTAVDKYDAAALSEDDIGTAGQVRRVKAIAIAKAEQELSDDNLRASILAANCGHIRASLLRRQAVHRNEPFGRYDNSMFAAAMFFIVVDVAKRDKIFHGVFAFVFVVADVMQLKDFAWVVGRQHRAVPAASDASKPVSL